MVVLSKFVPGTAGGPTTSTPRELTDACYFYIKDTQAYRYVYEKTGGYTVG